jgi:hypothetical protein
MSCERQSASNGTAQMVTCSGMRFLKVYDRAPLIWFQSVASPGAPSEYSFTSIPVFSECDPVT